jgi:hypothetical protein
MGSTTAPGQICPTPDDPIPGDVNLDGVVGDADPKLVIENFGLDDRVTPDVDLALSSGAPPTNGMITSLDDAPAPRHEVRRHAGDAKL